MKIYRCICFTTDGCNGSSVNLKLNKMKKPITNNLTTYMQGRNLNIFQKADAIIEYNKLLDYINNLEEAISVTRCCTTFVCDIDKGIRCDGSIADYKDGKCKICGQQAN